jgi:hypothetical protein
LVVVSSARIYPRVWLSIVRKSDVGDLASREHFEGLDDPEDATAN